MLQLVRGSIRFGRRLGDPGDAIELRNVAFILYQHIPTMWMTSKDKPEVMWPPATFAQRGVAVPFTTPALAGARVRHGSKGAELVVPHPASPRGVYVPAWSEIAESCAPTLHDVFLLERIGRLGPITPRDIRRVARSVAAEGAAGRAARDAARLADEREQRQHAMTQVSLLQRLLMQTEGGTSSLAELDRRGKDAIRQTASALGRPATSVASDLEYLATAYTPIGLDAGLQSAECPATMADLARLHADLKPWLSPDRPAVTLIRSAAGTTLGLAEQALGQAIAQADDLPSLLRSLAAGSPVADAKQRALARLEWLLDGWQQICLVWQLAVAAGNAQAALAEMSLMVPVLPQEADPHIRTAPDETERQRLLRAVQNSDEWRTGSTVFSLIARNERIRAMAA